MYVLKNHLLTAVEFICLCYVNGQWMVKTQVQRLNRWPHLHNEPHPHPHQTNPTLLITIKPKQNNLTAGRGDGMECYVSNK